jgi:flagellar basal-body rod protein FlgB
MFSADGILGRSFAIAAAGLDGLAMRQQVHAENLANVDSVGYHAKTLDFESTLDQVLHRPDPGHRYSNPLGGGGAIDASSGASLSSSFTVSQQAGGGGVDRTTEVTAMMNDNVRFRVLTQQVTNQLSAAKSVIAEMGRG